MKKLPSHRRTLAGLVTVACVLLALVAARMAPADTVVPSITLGQTTIANGVATVSGSITTPSPATAGLTINGQSLGLNAAGQFAGVINLGGQSVLSLAVRDGATGDVSTVTIPLTANLVGPGGVVSPDALSGIQAAALSIAKPVGGFVSGLEPITVGGHIADSGQLAGLTVNGVDALSSLQPNGNFSVPVPGTSREISVLMTDKQGVSVQTRYATVSPAYVSAASAVGLRVASVRYFKRHAKKTKQIRMLVTVKDRRAIAVRGAKVTVRSVKSGRIIGRLKVKKTNKLGRVGFVLHLRRAAFGKRLVVMTRAKTPLAKAAKRTSVRLPRLAPRRG
jgi:hypothetical protein